MIARPSALIACTLLLVAPYAFSSPAKLGDPSFESISAGLRTATASIGAWSLTSGSSNVMANGTHTAKAGTQFLFFPGTAVQNSVIEQNLTGFVPGVLYRATYWICGYNANAAPQQCAVEISLFNNKQDSFDYAVPGTTTAVGDSSNKWIQRTFDVVAPSAGGELNINVYRGTPLTDAYTALDDFDIRPVPVGAPKVQVSSPRGTRIQTDRKRFSIRGRTTGSLPTEFLNGRNGARSLAISGLAHWIARVRLHSGPNRLRFQATDIAGTGSAPVSIVVWKS